MEKRMAGDANGKLDRLLLRDFLPFRLNRLSDSVSMNLSQIYTDRFGLDIPEWRVLVTVGQREGCTAQHVVLSTRMHKTRVSRAVAALLKRKLISRVVNEKDSREGRLRLSMAGQRMYAALVPTALQRERALMSCLSLTQRNAFTTALSLLEESLGLNADE